jgi:rhodanese-related sulfurtransferase
MKCALPSGVQDLQTELWVVRGWRLVWTSPTATTDRKISANGIHVPSVDLREAAERTQRGAFYGAVHAPRGLLEYYADPTNDSHRREFIPNQRTILYCASGARSALAVETLQQLVIRTSRISRAA